MPKVNLYNMSGEKIGQCDLSDSVFGIAPNQTAMHDMVKHHLAARRQGTQSALTRAEVSGGGRKPWRQKGTGRARQGSTRAPQWIHGGVAFAPKPRNYRYAINKKVRRLAMKSALSSKVLDGGIYVIDNLSMDEMKTKTFKAFLDKLDVKRGALVITPEPRENVIKSARNIPGVKTTVSGVISVYDILRAGAVILDQNAALKIQEVYAE